MDANPHQQEDYSADGIHHKVRRMLSESISTPFFSKNRDHMPRVLNLHADLFEDDGSFKLTANIPGFGKEDVRVSATAKSIDVHLSVAKEEVQVDGEKEHSECSNFHSSYYLDSLIVPKSIEVSYEKGVLTVIAIKRK